MIAIFTGCVEWADFVKESPKPAFDIEDPNASEPPEEMVSNETATVSLDTEVDPSRDYCYILGGLAGLAPDDFILDEDEAYWYYWNQNGTYQLDKETSSSTRISEHKIDGVSSGWFYYIRQFEDAERYEVCRMDSTGENVVCLFDDTQAYPFAHNLYVGDHYLVIHVGASESYFYCYDLETSEITKLAIQNPYQPIILFNDRLYVLQFDSISVTDLKTKKTEICLDFEGHNIVITFTILGGEIYYLEGNPDKIYRYTEGERKLIFRDNDDDGEDEVLESHSIKVCDNKLYLLLRIYKNGQNRSTVLVYDPSVDQIRECLSIDPAIKPYIDYNRLIYLDEDWIPRCVLIE